MYIELFITLNCFMLHRVGNIFLAYQAEEHSECLRTIIFPVSFIIVAPSTYILYGHLL